MKKLAYLLMLLFSVVLFACENDDTPDTPEIEFPNDDSLGVYLSDFNDGNVPDGDTWVILDTIATTSDFAALNSHLKDGITLEFPNITSIPEMAFDSNTRKFKVHAPLATSIEWGAFSFCGGLSEVSFPSVTTIGFMAFEESGLTSIDLPNVTRIKSSTFSNSISLTEVSIPLATYFGNYAFAKCSALETIVLPSAVEIGEEVFSDCTALSYISLPSVTKIGSGAFLICDALSTLDLATASGVMLQELNTDLFKTYPSKTYNEGNITLNIGGENVFYVFGDNLTVGGNSYDFKEIYIDGVRSEEVEGVYLQDFITGTMITGSNWVILDRTPSNEDFAGLLNGLSNGISLEFPYLTSMPNAAFMNCKQRFSISCPRLLTLESGYYDSESDVYYGTFSGCSGLTDVSFISATNLGDYAFVGCSSLESIELSSYKSTILEVLGKDMFLNSAAPAESYQGNISLAIGTANSANISGNTLTIGDNSYTFKEITQQ